MRAKLALRARISDDPGRREAKAGAPAHAHVKPPVRSRRAEPADGEYAEDFNESRPTAAPTAASARPPRLTSRASGRTSIPSTWRARLLHEGGHRAPAAFFDTDKVALLGRQTVSVTKTR